MPKTPSGKSEPAPKAPIQCKACLDFEDLDEDGIYTCRVCFEEATEKAELVEPCNCTGTQRYVHFKCLRMWQDNVIRNSQQGFGVSDERAYICSVCQVPFSIPPQVQASTSPWCRCIISILRVLCGALCLGIFLFSLTSTHPQNLLVCALAVLGTVLLAMHARGMRLVMRMDALGQLGLVVIHQGDDVDGLRPGVLLVASDELEDSMFRRSVVLLYKHDSDGAAGVMLTKGLEPRILYNYPPGDPIRASPYVSHYAGGPVGMPHWGRQADHHVLLQNTQGGFGFAEVPMEGGEPVYVSTRPREAIDHLGNTSRINSENKARLFHGISTWEGGQLEGEVRTTCWGFCNATWEDLQGDTEALWHRLVASPRLQWM